MAVRLKPHSRLRFGSLIETGGVAFWDVLDLPVIPVQADDVQYTVKSEDRIDLLAHRFYADPVLWWVIAVANDMEELPTALKTGETIRIPAPRYVLQTLFTKSGGLP